MAILRPVSALVVLECQGRLAAYDETKEAGLSLEETVYDRWILTSDHRLEILTL